MSLYGKDGRPNLPNTSRLVCHALASIYRGSVPLIKAKANGSAEHVLGFVAQSKH